MQAWETISARFPTWVFSVKCSYSTPSSQFIVATFWYMSVVTCPTVCALFRRPLLHEALLHLAVGLLQVARCRGDP